MDGGRTAAKDIDGAIRDLADAPPEKAITELAAVANRAVIELNKVARTQANALRGAPEWGKWARLANATRSTVLQMAAVRDSLKAMGAPTPTEES
jgi:hypothetical protein